MNWHEDKAIGHTRHRPTSDRFLVLHSAMAYILQLLWWVSLGRYEDRRQRQDASSQQRISMCVKCTV